MAFAIRNTDDDKIHLFDYTGSPATGLPVYEGIAESGTATSASAWRIKKYVYDALNQAISIKFAVVSPSNAAIYDNRATYTYA